MLKIFSEFKISVISWYGWKKTFSVFQIWVIAWHDEKHMETKKFSLYFKFGWSHDKTKKWLILNTFCSFSAFSEKVNFLPFRNIFSWYYHRKCNKMGPCSPVSAIIMGGDFHHNPPPFFHRFRKLGENYIFFTIK